jgi:hypothetical protein
MRSLLFIFSHSAHFYLFAPVFHGKQTPEKGTIVGYVAVIDKLSLPVPIQLPIPLICDQNKSYETEDWRVFPSSYLPEDHKKLTQIEALYKHLVF